MTDFQLRLIDLLQEETEKLRPLRYRPIETLVPSLRPSRSKKTRRARNPKPPKERVPKIPIPKALKPKRPNIRAAVEIECVETGHRFCSINHLSRELRIGYSVARHLVINHYERGGLHYRQSGDLNWAPCPRRRTSPSKVPIRCIETGQEWAALQHASRDLGRSGDQLRLAIETGKAIRGLHLEYA